MSPSIKYDIFTLKKNDTDYKHHRIDCQRESPAALLGCRGVVLLFCDPVCVPHIFILVKNLSKLDRISLLSKTYKPLCFPEKQKERLSDARLPQARVQFGCFLPLLPQLSVHPRRPPRCPPPLHSLGQLLRTLPMGRLLYPHGLWRGWGQEFLSLSSQCNYFHHNLTSIATAYSLHSTQTRPCVPLVHLGARMPLLYFCCHFQCHL